MNSRPRRVPTELAALALGVREVTIRQWARRGKITRYGTARRALYDLDELTELARTTTPTPSATVSTPPTTAVSASGTPVSGVPVPHN
ncbi:helix-turn-helix domain-containing protein [Streptomyces sp. NPDC048404]|uniref:helix-turn-helix domain-containing protein n=1 Tax=unclassified Streptomyces TaxID=2593676 RepID=UPI00342C7BC8